LAFHLQLADSLTVILDRVSRSTVSFATEERTSIGSTVAQDDSVGPPWQA
jgi:hypothetical protein